MNSWIVGTLIILGTVLVACGGQEPDPALKSPAAIPKVLEATPSPTSHPTPEPTPTLVATSFHTPLPAATSTPQLTPIPMATTAPAPAPAPAPTPTPTPPIQVGHSVGSTLPHFEFTLVDGSKQSTAHLSSQGKPVFLFFFATWCPTCQAELRRMKEVYPEFSDKVDFYALGQDSSESIEQMETYRKEQDHPWPVALIQPNVLRDLRVLQQSTKIAVDHRGIITYRDGYARGDPGKWREVFKDLVHQAGG